MNANLIIKASAGTGKTFAIATRYLQLLVLGKARPEQILALTFSRAAAQEIYDKILERLWRAAGADVSPSGKSAAEVAAARSAAALEERDYLLDGLPASQRAQAERAADWSPDFFASLLRRVIDAQHHDTIATLDSFILRIVRSFPLEMGFQREVSVLDDYGRSLAVEKAIEAVLASTGDDRSLKDDFLAAQENSAVRSGLSKTRDAAKTWGPFLHDRPEAASWSAASMLDALGVEASPSMPDLSAIPVTGKTTGLPDKVLDRVLKFSGGRVKDGDIFKNQAGECLSFFLDNPQATSFSPPSAKHPKATEFGVQGADAVRAAARWMVATLFSRKLNVVAAKLRLASALETAYDASTRRKGMLTFSDFTDCQAANENSEKGLRLQNLQFRLDARFDHWALDEFQDTSMPQWNCLRRLVDEALSGDGGSVMAVGDFKQSIYAWRGGDDQPFKELIAAVSAAGGAVAPLDLSHRYQKNTADFVNAVFCPSNVRAVAGGDCAEAQDIWEHDCWPRGGHVANGADDFVEIVGVRPDAADAAPAPDAADDDGDADLHPSAAMRILARPVCDCVRALIERRLAEKSALEATGRPFKPDSIGILVRNNADGLYLAERLRAAKTSAPGGSLPIPVVWEGQSGVLDAPAVRALLELLWLAEHPEDSFSWA
ncbi:MAG: UvrD-helicase domain-containing protein, partial [Kiritimatiellae bacterium]|nr:UvrD-helicase domain-containing protein [Kiritimatiellia bacterium]